MQKIAAMSMLGKIGFFAADDNFWLNVLFIQSRENFLKGEKKFGFYSDKILNQEKFLWQIFWFFSQKSPSIILMYPQQISIIIKINWRVFFSTLKFVKISFFSQVFFLSSFETILRNYQWCLGVRANSHHRRPTGFPVNSSRPKNWRWEPKKKNKQTGFVFLRIDPLLFDLSLLGIEIQKMRYHLQFPWYKRIVNKKNFFFLERKNGYFYGYVDYCWVKVNFLEVYGHPHKKNTTDNYGKIRE